MKLGLIAGVAAVAIGAGSASAQYAVPHRGHYHVAPSYAAPLTYGGYGYPSYSSGFGGSFYPGVPSGGFQTSPGYGGYSAYPFNGYRNSGGYGSWDGHHHHHHHGHR
ncbi:MAG: hypothetical protein K8U57_34530 [Planctomycetes bacterium]|nr:hypothetical protein [Planctomycetota bacterium]